MKFTYEYKTSSNERKNGVIDASCKDEVYKKLKAKGIRPFRVKLAPGIANRVRSLGKRWIAIVLLLVATLGFFWLWLSAEERVQAVVSGTDESLQFADRHQIYGDPSIMEMIERNSYADIFEDEGERILAYFAQPGRDVALPVAMRQNAQALVSAISHEIKFDREEQREVHELKLIVNGMKNELREYLLESTPESYLRELYERQQEEMLIYNRVLNELKGCDEPAVWADRNSRLRDLGIKTIPRPKKGT